MYAYIKQNTKLFHSPRRSRNKGLNEQQTDGTNRKFVLGWQTQTQSTLSVIVLKVNKLNNPIKGRNFQTGLKSKINNIVICKKNTLNIKTDMLRTKGWGENIPYKLVISSV